MPRVLSILRLSLLSSVSPGGGCCRLDQKIQTDTYSTYSCTAPRGEPGAKRTDDSIIGGGGGSIGR